MAFSSQTINVFSKPSILFSVNDWNASIKVPSITAIVTLNSYQTKSSIKTPTIVFTSYDKPSYNFHYTSSALRFSSSFDGSKAPEVYIELKKPVVSFNVIVPNSYNASITLKPVRHISSVAVSNGAMLGKVLPTIGLSFTASFTASKQRLCYAFNTVTTAHSVYTNYNFNSFFKFGSKQYGVNEDGVWEIDGDRDRVTSTSSGTLISSQIDFPISAYGSQEMKQCSDAILYMRSDGDMEIIAITDEEEAREGFIVSHDGRNGMHRRRVKIPKGLKGNAWQFKIKNVEGSDFSINAFEVFLRKLQRIKW